MVHQEDSPILMGLLFSLRIIKDSKVPRFQTVFLQTLSWRVLFSTPNDQAPFLQALLRFLMRYRDLYPLKSCCICWGLWLEATIGSNGGLDAWVR